MGLRLLLGPVSSGKTTRIFEEITKETKDGCNGADEEGSVLYLTPEQSSLYAQKALLEYAGRLSEEAPKQEKSRDRSLLKTQVYSFKRLAFTVFDETGLAPVTFLDDVGKSMVLEKVCAMHESELLYYRRSVGQKGFIDQLNAMLRECLQYGMDKDVLTRIMKSQEENRVLYRKMHDILLLLTSFEEITGETVMPSESVLDLLCKKIPESSRIRHSIVYVDGFSGFTPQQYRVLTMLMLYSRSLTVTLPIPLDEAKKAEKYTDFRALDLTPFYPVQKSLVKLERMSADHHQKLTVEYFDKDLRGGLLSYASANLFAQGSSAYDGEEKTVYRLKAHTMREEVEQVFHEILHLAREEKVPYRRITLAVSDLNAYSSVIRRAASLYKVPLFIDEKADVSLNPYIQWLENIGSLITSGFSYESFIALIKTGLTCLSASDCDEVENRFLSENRTGKRRILEGLRQEDAPKSWRTLSDALETFDMAVSKRHKVEEFDLALTRLEQTMQIKEQLDKLSEEIKEDGNLGLSLQFSRIYEENQRTREQLVEVFGSTEDTFENYSRVLKMGVQLTRMGQIPPSLDEVTVTDLKRSVPNTCDVVLFLGIQAGAFPLPSGGSGLFTDMEKEVLRQYTETAGDEREDLMEQYYQVYKIMGKAQKSCGFYSHSIDDMGEEIGVSPLWKRLDQILGDKGLREADNPVTLPLPLFYEGERQLTGNTRDYLEKKGFHEQLEAVDKGQKTKDDLRVLGDFKSRRVMDPEKRLLSVSALEMYAKCPYSYFLRHGLNLEKRDQPRADRMQDGSVLHEVLKAAGGVLENELSEEEAQKIAEKLMNEESAVYPVYQSSGKFRYFWRQLEKTAARSLKLLSEQAAHSRFTHAAFEWSFGIKDDKGAMAVEPMVLSIGKGRKIQLEGRIDRVDLWDSGSERYIRIIDYKSGSTSFSTSEIYNGLQLQLPVYMEESRKAFHAKPAGYFYFHLSPAKVDKKKADSPDSARKEERKNGTLDGLFVEDRAIVNAMDDTVENNDGSGPIAVKAVLKKDGSSFNRNSTKHCTSPENMEALETFVNGKIVDMANDMKNGMIRRHPVQMGQYAYCHYCDYQAACPFDAKMKGCEYKKQETIKESEFFQMLSEGKDGQEAIQGMDSGKEQE